MKFILLILISILLSTLVYAEQEVENHSALYHAKDWVHDGVFTQGVEGPAVANNGVLYAVNFQEEGTIGRVKGKDQVELLVKLSNGSVGNGIRFDHKGDMYIADYVNHNVLHISADKLENTSLNALDVNVYSHSPLMSQPNDIAMMDNGILFASDPDWPTNSGQLWRVDTRKRVTLLEESMGTTNGIEVSPDNKTLYVNESIQRRIWQYDLTAQGNITNKRQLISFNDFGLDGMRADKQGNLYVSRYGKGVIAIISPQGNLLREVSLKGKYPTNVAFGGEDGKTVFVTLQKRGAIEKFNSEFVGRSFSVYP
jgi:sugar lactone lactonase YvrE